jgi:hypothetical protein
LYRMPAISQGLLLHYCWPHLYYPRSLIFPTILSSMAALYTHPPYRRYT